MNEGLQLANAEVDEAAGNPELVIYPGCLGECSQGCEVGVYIRNDGRLHDPEYPPARSSAARFELQSLFGNREER